MKNVVRLLTSVPDVTPAMLDAEFWWSRLSEPDRPSLNASAIERFNRQVYQKLNMPAVLELPDSLSADEVRERIALYKKPASARYDGNGQPYRDEDYGWIMPDLRDSHYFSQAFCIVTKRTSVRAFPTDAVATSVPFEFEYDHFQETSVDVGWPVIALAWNSNSQWQFCLTPHYWGWIKNSALGQVTQEVFQQFAAPEQWVTTLSSRGLVGVGMDRGLTPQMGTRLPLIEETDEVYRVLVPHRSQKGGMAVADQGTIHKKSYISEFTRGYLPLTAKNLLEQAFAVLGERYAWGDSRIGIFGRDCSRLVKDVYATTGVQLPRNAHEQEAVCQPIVTFTDSMSAADRKAAIVEHAIPGDLIFMPAHVMLYLGHLNSEPYVIHAKGTPHECVIVSTLMLNEDTPKGALLHRLTSVGRV